jgi:hypothetical protein
LNLDVALTEGTWDFWLVDLDPGNEFKASFDALLVLAQRNRGCGFLGLEWCDWNYLPVADIHVYSGSPFALDFNNISDARTFSIRVGTTAAPEPATLALAGLGLAGLAALRRRDSAGLQPSRRSEVVARVVQAPGG